MGLAVVVRIANVSDVAEGEMSAFEVVQLKGCRMANVVVRRVSDLDPSCPSAEVPSVEESHVVDTLPSSNAPREKVIHGHPCLPAQDGGPQTSRPASA
jgi:hypothetical protein